MLFSIPSYHVGWHVGLAVFVNCRDEKIASLEKQVEGLRAQLSRSINTTGLDGGSTEAVFHSPVHAHTAHSDAQPSSFAAAENTSQVLEGALQAQEQLKAELAKSHAQKVEVESKLQELEQVRDNLNEKLKLVAIAVTA
jgi:vacuolar-type H+-ATPase subunit I/STV1